MVRVWLERCSVEKTKNGMFARTEYLRLKEGKEVWRREGVETDRRTFQGKMYENVTRTTSTAENCGEQSGENEFNRTSQPPSLFQKDFTHMLAITREEEMRVQQREKKCKAKREEKALTGGQTK